MQAVIDNSIAEWAHILVDLSGLRGGGGGGGVGGQTNTLQTMLHFHQVHVTIDVGLEYKQTYAVHTQKLSSSISILEPNSIELCNMCSILYLSG